MSISSFTTVVMLDCRAAALTISVPKSTDIINRVITFKDLYGSSITNNITLSTYNGDLFENGLNTLVISNSFQSVNLYAGLPGKWLNVGGSAATSGTGGIGVIPSFISALTVSTNLLTAVTISNTGTISTNTLGAGSAWITSLNAGATTTIGLSNTGFFSNSTGISTNTLGVATNMSVCNILSTNILGAGSAWITTLNAGAATTIGLSNTGSFSNIGGMSTNTLGVATTASISNISTISIGGGAGTFTTLNAGATTTIGHSNTGFFSNSTGISTNTLGVATNMSVCNILSTNILGAGTGYITTLNAGVTTTGGLTNTGAFSNSAIISTNSLGAGSANITTLNAGSISNSGLISTNTLNTGSISSILGFISSLRVDSLQIGLSTGYINMGDIITTSISSLITNTNFLNAQGISTASLSSAYGFFTTISANTIYAKFIGDGSSLTGVTIGTTTNMSNTNYFSNGGSISTNSLGVATNMSVCNILSTNILGAGSAWITTLNAGATTTIGLSNTGFFSNSTGISTNTLGVATNMSVCNITSTNTLGAGSAWITTLNAGALNMCNNNISNVQNQYFQYGGSIQAQLGGTGGQQGILNISYPAAGTGHTNDGIIYIWGGSTSGNRYINLDSTNIGITVPLGAGNLWLNANTINVGSLNMYSNTIYNVSNIIGSGELPITAATGCNINITGTYVSVNASAGISNIASGAPLYLQTNSTYPIQVYSTGELDLYAGWNGSPGLIASNVVINAGGSVNITAVSNISLNASIINANAGSISNVAVIRTVSLSTNTISTNSLIVGGTLYGRLAIQSNATTLTNPVQVIITVPNKTYFFADYTNLTNYITISNYGAQSGDYINIVNTGNSGSPATFNILDGSVNPSTNIRYIYPGHAGVIAYNSGTWWAM